MVLCCLGSSRALKPISQFQVCMLGKVRAIKFLQSFTNDGAWVKVKGSSCELSPSPATLGKG